MSPMRNALRLASMYFIAAACTSLALSARADKHAYRVDNATYRQECGSCHVPYPPALLAAPSWSAVMGGLDRHFGTDASLEPAARTQVLAFLEKNAGGRDTSANGKPLLRISESPWFTREHRKEIAAGTAKRADVKSIANCGACHAGAEQGDYSKRGLQVPGGRAR
ncbi:MAG: diheme cytochrome c [Betaproteobacteria bacterium]|nr:diheme cytochrome c [Betaproteobacteria bacterium]